MDILPSFIELAKARLPEFREHFFVGNAMTWIPPRRFDYVRTELVYVPAEQERQYLEFLLENHLEPGGKLLVTNYGEDLPNIEKVIHPGSHPTARIIDRLEDLGFKVAGHRDGYDPIKDRKCRVAIVVAEH
jgi:hypothetical protein